MCCEHEILTLKEICTHWSQKQPKTLFCLLLNLLPSLVIVEGIELGKNCEEKLNRSPALAVEWLLFAASAICCEWAGVQGMQLVVAHDWSTTGWNYFQSFFAHVYIYVHTKSNVLLSPYFPYMQPSEKEKKTNFEGDMEENVKSTHLSIHKSF